MGKTLAQVLIGWPTLIVSFGFAQANRFAQRIDYHLIIKKENGYVVYFRSRPFEKTIF